MQVEMPKHLLKVSWRILIKNGHTIAPTGVILERRPYERAGLSGRRSREASNADGEEATEGHYDCKVSANIVERVIKSLSADIVYPSRSYGPLYYGECLTPTQD